MEMYAYGNVYMEACEIYAIRSSSMTYRQYSIEFLLTRREHGSHIEQLVDINLFIKENSVDRDCILRQNEPPYATRNGRGNRGRGTRGSHHHGRGGNRNGRPPAMQRETVKITRMPVKTGRSALTLLLNKLGEDNVEAVADSITKVFAETEDLNELISWFIETTLPQTALADTFAAMWVRVFKRNAEVKNAYMKKTRQIFESLKYDSSERDNEVIVQLAHAIPALNRCNAITFRPVQMLIGSYVDNLRVVGGACLEALALIIPSNIPSSTGKYLNVYVAPMPRESRETRADHLMQCLATAGTHLSISILLMDAFLAPSTGINSTGASSYSSLIELESGTAPSQWQASLFVELLKRNRISRTVISQHVQELIERVQASPETIDALLVLMSSCGTWISPMIKEEAGAKAKQIVDNATAFGVSMKIRFKFMDLLDLQARNWQPKRKN